MPSQAMRRFLPRPRRSTIQRFFYLCFLQIIFRSSVSGLPSPIGVTGTVAQKNPNTQPEEK
jgi:hypothetical protein